MGRVTVEQTRLTLVSLAVACEQAFGPFPCYFFPQKEPRACSQATLAAVSRLVTQHSSWEECCVTSLKTAAKEIRVCLHEGGGPQVGEVTCGKLPHLTCKRDHIKIRDFKDPCLGSPTSM